MATKSTKRHKKEMVTKVGKKVSNVRKSAVRKKAAVRPPGRPSLFCEESAMRVLTRVMEGDCLEVACTPEDVPCKRTWLRWVAADVLCRRKLQHPEREFYKRVGEVLDGKVVS